MKSSSLTPEQEGALDEARDLEERYKKAADDAESLCSKRNAAVLHAIRLHVSYSRIASHLGLTASRIGQIKKRVL